MEVGHSGGSKGEGHAGCVPSVLADNFVPTLRPKWHVFLRIVELSDDERVLLPRVIDDKKRP